MYIICGQGPVGLKQIKIYTYLLQAVIMPDCQSQMLWHEPALWYMKGNPLPSTLTCSYLLASTNPECVSLKEAEVPTRYFN